MPSLTRESRALLAFTLAVVLLLGSLGSIGTSVAAALRWLLTDFAESSVPLALVLLVLAVGVTLLARGAANARPDDLAADGWHHLAVAAAWLALVQVVLSLLALIGAIAGTWP